MVNAHVNPLATADSTEDVIEQTSGGAVEPVKPFAQTFNVPLKVILPPLTSKMDPKMTKVTVAESDTNTTDNNMDKTLHVDEIDCGVSVSTNKQQEWAFTLYDFDGRGKITREDLGQLLQSLYSAVGSSITLPPDGPKTLKLQLSVSPDDVKNSDTTITMAQSASTAEATVPTTVTVSPACNEAGISALSPATKVQNLHSVPHKDKHSRHKKSNSASANIAAVAAAAAAACDVNTMTESPEKCSKVHAKAALNNASSRLNKTCNSDKEEKACNVSGVELRNNLSGNGNKGHGGHRSPTKRLSAAEHSHLVDLVQKNMEKNQQGKHHKLRRHHSEAVRQISSNNRSVLENPDRRNYYLDLAGIENYEQGPAATGNPHHRHRQHHSGSPKARHRHREPSSSNASPVKASKPRYHHHHSGGHGKGDQAHGITTGDLSREVVEEEEEGVENIVEQQADSFARFVEEDINKCASPAAKPNARLGQSCGYTPPSGQGQAECPDALVSTSFQPKSSSTPQKQKCRPASMSLPTHLPEQCVSPHHHRRHRGRDKNHSRAMQQVAEWIEREQMLKTPSGDSLVLQRHEHHHIHEHHHHHHYHHYHDPT